MTSPSPRSLMLRRAVLTSLSGKGITVVTQLLAVPLAIGALGVERYGAYAMLTAIFLWTSAASVVVASALTLQLVPANAEGDTQRESRLFSTAFFFALATAALLFVGFQVMLGTLQIDHLFGLDRPAFAVDLHMAAMAMALLLPANVLFSLAEAAQAGYQRQYVNNLLQMGANLTTLVALLLVVRLAPSICNMVLAMFLPATLSRVVNMGLLWAARPHLRPSFKLAQWPTLLALLAMGAAFAVTQAGSFLYLQFPTFHVGRASGLSAAAYLSTMMLVISISGNFLVMFTQPLMPALRDAVTRGDQAWVRRTHSMVLKRLVPYISLAALAIAVGGSFFVSQLTRQVVHFDFMTQCLWAAFFWIVAWEHVHYSFVVGMGRVWLAACLYVAGALLMLGCAMLLIPAHGLAGAFAAMCIGPLVCTVLAFPVIVRRLLGRADGT